MVRLAVIEELELPSRLVQRNDTSGTKRSRSHPVHSPIHIDSDDESECGSGTACHVSRMSAYALFSGLRAPETTSNNDRSVRSSVHSTSSSMTTSSTVSSVNEQCLLSAEAVWDHVAILPDELPFAIGDIISVLDYSSHEELWYGNCRERVGWFPSSYVRVLNGNPSTSGALTLSYFPQSMRFLRAKIVQELMQTERDYVNLLQNIVQGFAEQCRRRNDLFSGARVQRLFGNIESIYALHCKVLRELELAFNENIPESSAVGAVFLRNRSKFSIYSEYCNNRPVSSAELASLIEQSHYYQFFEACRLLRGMPKLPLEGFLLTPVQRICRYPLQLSELLKATPPSHIDREQVQAAASAMKNVAAMINEKKRRLEGLQQIALWQMNVEGWRGPDLVETNSRMIHSGEVYCRCIIGGNVLWHKDVLLFLFDQSVVICKKDLIRRNFYIFRDQISLDSTTFLNCDDGKDLSTGLNLKNSWKLVMIGKELIFTCKDRNSKVAWIEHLQRPFIYSPATTEERRLIRETICHTSSR
uniref:DH domain-containing protein n=1 Tax=Setaria digitata TaxID=48799 RepID=A0A915Q2D6_9BILA